MQKKGKQSVIKQCNTSRWGHGVKSVWWTLVEWVLKQSWLKWMWCDFSLKLSTQSVRLKRSFRRFISFSEMKKKLQSLHWERKRSRSSRWWRRSWRRWTDTSQLFHTQSKTQRRWWKPATSAFWRWRLNSASLIVHKITYQLPNQWSNVYSHSLRL